MGESVNFAIFNCILENNSRWEAVTRKSRGLHLGLNLPSVFVFKEVHHGKSFIIIK